MSLVEEWKSQNKHCPKHYSDEFYANLKLFVGFLKELDEYIGAVNGGKPPVGPFLFSIVQSAVSVGLANEETRKNIINVVVEKVAEKCVQKTVTTRDPKMLPNVVQTLFQDLPQAVSDKIVNVVNSKVLDDECVGDVFDYVDSLLASLLKHQILQNEKFPDDERYHPLLELYFSTSSSSR
jgi:hypothetical protein